MIHHFVFDTVGFISFHSDFFGSNHQLSRKVKIDVERCLSPDFLNYKLIIPSIVFVEIFDKQLSDDERTVRFRSEILCRYFDSEDVEIKGLEREVIEIYNSIDDEIIKLETHDKIVLSSAIQMKAKLITNDSKIKTYNDYTHSVELVF